MSSNMYPYNRPTEGGVLNVTENGSVSLAGTNYSEINVSVSGGGGDLGAGFELMALDNNNQSLGCDIGGFVGALYITKNTGVAPVLPSGTTYRLVGFYDDNENEIIITSDDQVSAMITPAGGSPTSYTDFELVDFGDEKAVQFSPAALAVEGTVYTFIITPSA